MAQFGLWITGTLLGTLCGSTTFDQIPYGIGHWESHLGNHRARLHVSESVDAVQVHIPWRRRDAVPEQKQILVFDATTSERVNNVVRVVIQREYGILAFQPKTLPGEYHVYYMPHDVSGWAHMPTVTYPEPSSQFDADWLARNQLAADDLLGKRWQHLPQAQVLEFQARTEFHRFDPMEVIATREEVSALRTAHPGHPFLLFPEDREHPIRMKSDLPLRWVQTGPSNEFEGTACRSEFYAFQVGVYAVAEEIELVDASFSDLSNGEGAVISSDAFRCINLAGTDWLGRPFTKRVRVEPGTVAPLWFGIQIPQTAQAGDYHGRVIIHPRGAKPTTVQLKLSVSTEVVDDQGDNDLWRQARLRWLNSTIGIDDDVVPPYTPLEVNGSAVGCLNREVQFAETGLPESIRSNGVQILSAPMQMVVETPDGPATWTDAAAEITRHAPGTVVWDASSANDKLEMQCRAKMEFDGYLNLRIKLKAIQATDLGDIRLEIPLKRDIAKYMMGLGRKGGIRPQEWNWVWDENLANNAVWLGDVDAGLHCKLKGAEDTWDLYNLKSSGVPESWGNDAKGGCTVTEEGDAVVFRAYSGARSIAAGETLEFRFGLLITPVKPLDPDHWNQRYYHAHVPVDTAVENGANIINIHHGNELNPNINYPFVARDKLHAYIREAHEKGVKIKLYYTVRELSNYVAEMWALRSLGHEIFTPGAGGGDSWLQEHLVDDYAPAWHHPLSPDVVDASIATTGLSRWHNYYLEGLRWLLRNVQLDGLYLDGIGYDREIMKRVRKVMERERPGSLIDFHSGNNFHPQYGLANCANQYMEHFPYIDSLWFGEGFDYNESPDYWLVEISGIPFGLFGEMLQDNGNPWRGMIYGMSARYYSGADPKHLWRFWDEFGIQDSEIIGYWNPACPVRTDVSDVLATVYRKTDKVLISIASWSPEPANCRLLIDWKALGLHPEGVTCSAPEIEGFQSEASFGPSDTIPVEPGKGWLIVLNTEPEGKR